MFTVKALRAREQRDTGKSLLEDVEIITFGTQGDRRDRIFSKLCEYDAKTGRVYSEGEVEIELASLPGELLAATGRSGESPARSVAGKPGARIHVWTSGLTFNEKTRVASTERLVRFRFLRGTGQAKGAVYDSYQRTLRLTSDVQILLQKRARLSPPKTRHPRSKFWRRSWFTFSARARCCCGSHEYARHWPEGAVGSCEVRRRC